MTGPLDLSTRQRVHLIGAGGSAMTAIATILQRHGHAVTGSDMADSPRVARLRAGGIPVLVGHDPSLVEGVDVVIANSDIPEHDIELAAARAAGVTVLRRPEVMGAICGLRRTVAVAGAHGKTTTTAMLAVALQAAGADPSYLVGGELTGTESGLHWGDGELFVVEADESDGTFLQLGAKAAILTNVEPDHLDRWGSFEALRDGFRRFLDAVDGPRVVCADDEGARALAAEVGGCVLYGTSPEAAYRLVDVSTDRDGTSFRLMWGGRTLSVRIPIPGIHNARNAGAVLAMCDRLGVDVAAAAAALAAHVGVHRRYEHRGEAAGITLVDSYDHLPTEVASVLAAARAGSWRRIVCVFQPHRFTRTAALWRDFAHSFVDADVVAVTDVYPFGQKPIPGVTGKLIVDAVLDAHPRTRLAWLPSRDDLRRWLLTELRDGDLCLTLGAGDLTTLPDELLPLLEAR